MDSRDRITTILNLEEPDVVGVADKIWPDTVVRWRKEGLPRGIDVSDYLRFDGIFSARVDLDVRPRYQSFVYEETDGWKLSYDGWGAIYKHWKGRTATPSLHEPGIRNLEDFKERIEPFLEIEDPRRIFSLKNPFQGALERKIREPLRS